MSSLEKMKQILGTTKGAADAAGDGGKAATRPKPRPIDMPYTGLLREDQDPNDYGLNAGRRKNQSALSGWHNLLCGLTGAGKGRRMFCPNIIMWGQQPVVAMSTKGDLAEVTIRKRAQRGPVYLMDLSQEVREEELKGVDVTRVKSDPCALVNTDDESMMMSDLLQATAKIGAASGGGSGNSDSTWENLAARPLAAFIRTGGLMPDPQTKEMVYGGGVQWVLEALDNPPKKLKDGEEEPPEESDLVTPNWSNAYLRASSMLESKHASALRAVMKMTEKQRDSVAMNMRNALKAWSLDAVAGDQDAVVFEPAMLEQPGATLYIVSPMDGSAASAACAVIEQLIQHWRRNVARNLPTLGLFLDELAQCAPLPHLSEHISVLRGYNVRLIAGVQSTKQLKRRYPDAWEEMLVTFPSVLILPGTPEKELLEQAAWFAGEDDRSTSSTDEYGRTTRSTERLERVSSSELMPRRQGTARLLVGGQPGVLVNVPDISETDLLD